MLLFLSLSCNERRTIHSRGGLIQPGDESTNPEATRQRVRKSCGGGGGQPATRFAWPAGSGFCLLAILASSVMVASTTATVVEKLNSVSTHYRGQQKSHQLATRSLITNNHQQHQQQNLSSNLPAVEQLDSQSGDQQGSQATPTGSCPPQNDKQTTSDTYYKSQIGYTQREVSNFVRPMFYTLRLKVDPTKRKFTAQLMITMEILEPLAPPPPSPVATRPKRRAPQASDDQQQQQLAGYRYLTLHAGSNIQVKRAFYVYTTRGSIQIPASKIGHDQPNELLTIDFHPNVITAGQGLLLIVYSGQVNDTESHGLFVHHSLRPGKRTQPVATTNNSLGPNNNNTNNTNTNNNTPAAAAATIDDYGLATHMQPSFARRLFPSWDEPHLKARFSLIVVLPFRGYQTLSNMPVQRKSFSLSCSGEPLQEIEFHTTPLMSTYLLTLVIGRFDHLESITPNNCRVRVYFYSNHTQSLLIATPSSSSSEQQQQQQQTKLNEKLLKQTNNSNINHKRQAASLALSVATKTIDRLEFLLGVKYPLGKFDMIALRDFNSGGMENWGASIFNENYILFEQSTQISSTDIQVNGGRSRPKWMVVPLVVAHEIAHQWFGNLITSQSWTYLWLNEGFAQLLMYDLADYLYPQHHYWDMFLEDSRQSALHDDELLTTSHCLEPEVYSNRPMDAQNGSGIVGAVDELSLFDEITYNKGALVVKTVYYLLGRKQFFAGLQHYLLKHSYDVVRSHDLWLALEEANGFADGQLEELMKCWLNQEGYPLISVTIFEEPNHWRLRLSQTRFTLLPLDEIPSSPLNKTTDDSTSSTIGVDPIWALPVAISSELNPSPHASELQLSNLRRTSTSSNGGNSPPMPMTMTMPKASTGSAFLFADRTGTLLVAKASTGSWIKLNFNATGHHRVDYQMRLNRDGSQMQLQQNQVDMLTRMVPAIRDGSMCVIDRLNLVDDLFAMVRAGKKPTGFYLSFITQAYEEEWEPIVLRSIVDSLKRIRATIVSNAPNGRLQFLYDRYVLKYLAKVGSAISRSRARAMATATATAASGGGENGGILPKLAAAAVAPNPLGTTVSAPYTYTNTNQKQQQHQQQQNINQLKEIGDLIEASRIRFNDTEFYHKASLLFNRNFRSSSSNNNQQQQQPSSLFDSMDREMRAAIYSGAIMMIGSGSDNDNRDTTGKADEEEAAAVASDLATAAASEGPSADGLPVADGGGGGAHSGARNQNVTANLVWPQQFNSAANAASNLNAAAAALDNNNGSQVIDNSRSTWLPSIFASHYYRHHHYQHSLESQPEVSQSEGSSGASLSNSSGAGGRSPMDRTRVVFRRLLKAYETSESSGERYAICSALGNIDDHDERVRLLNLTIFDNHFRHQDAQHLLDSMSRTLAGRQLMWQQLKTNFKTIERRQLLAPFLRSISHGGLIEHQHQRQPANGDSGGEIDGIETQLRNLYQRYSKEYGKILSLAIELLLINSRWFKRDHEGLLQFLESTNSLK